MSGRSDTSVRKVAVGGALVVAAPLSLLSWLLVPASMVDGDEFVAEIVSIGTGTLIASLVTGALFFPFAVIGVMGLMHLLQGRPSLIGTIGGGLAVFGLTLNATALGAAGTLAEAARSDLAASESAGLVETTMGGATGVLILAGPLVAAVGTSLLGYALYAARTVPRASAVLLAIYGPLQVVGFASEAIPVITASYAVMALALIPVGIMLAGETTEDWEAPPTFEGFHRARGDAGTAVT
jgi:hypothetical protein